MEPLFSRRKFYWIPDKAKEITTIAGSSALIVQNAPGNISKAPKPSDRSTFSCDINPLYAQWCDREGIWTITDPKEKEIIKKILETGGKVIDDSVSVSAKLRVYAKCNNGSPRISVTYFTEITALGVKISKNVDPGKSVWLP